MILRVGKSLLGRFLLILVLITMELGSMPVQEAFAATLTVTNMNDSGPGSLRQAIADAGTGDLITFDPSLMGGIITLSSEFYIDKNLTIDGSGLSPQITLSGGFATRILQVASSANVTISNLILNGGISSNGSGGAILNAGTLTVNNSTFSDNGSDASGGAIAGGNLFITNSTFLKNSAADGGAIFGGGGVLEISGSTFYRNQAASGAGGAIRLLGNGETTIVNTTVTRNTAAEGGGIGIGGTNLVQIRNSTFAGNSADTSAEINMSGSYQLEVFNSVFVCVQNPVGNTCFEFPIAPTTTNSVLGYGTLYDYGLAELAENGGPTQTMALLPGSTLIDTGNDANCAATDQRGVTRPKGSHCDIGAYEHQAIVRYVKQDAVGLNDGSSWANAFTDLQPALAETFPDEEIWVAAGTYKPTTTTDRSISFNLHNGAALYGGFAGGETSLAQRDSAAHPTILSGDIGTVGDNSDNSYHVVVGSGTNNSAILDGFIVRGGNANVPFSNYQGGGLYTYLGEPFIANITFEANYADYGGGVFIGGDFSSPEMTSHPILKNLIFENNSAREGGGLLTENYIHAILTDVVFDGNTASTAGGGSEDRLGTISFSNVVFKNNTAGAGGGTQNYSRSEISMTDVTFNGNSAVFGGGMVNADMNPTLTNVTFYGNTAEQGGGMWNSDSKPLLTNVTFSNNSASEWGGAIYNDAENSEYSHFPSQTTLRNAILWGNTAPTGAQIYNGSASVAIISDSVVEGGFAGGTNIITADPLLGAPGNYGGFTETVPLQAGSSAIDMGNDANCPSTDQRGVTRPKGSHCDIGAYEYEDLTPPTVLSIVRADPNPTSDSTVNFTVTFSENVINVESGEFTLTTSGVTGPAIDNVTGSGVSYTVTVNTGSGSGTIRLDLVDDDSIRDLANLPLGGVGNGNGNFVNGQSFNIDWLSIAGNVGIPGTTLSYTDGSPKTATADGNGNYSFPVSYYWSGTVTPSKTGYTFSPASKTYSYLTTNMIAENYTATPITNTISGNAGVAGVVLSYTDGSPKTAITNGSGNYSFSISYNWSGTVTPSKTGYNFSPASRTYSNLTADQTAENYTATPITYIISGNAMLPGVTLSYTDGSPKTATTDSGGDYSFSVSYNWSGTVIPSRTGFTFTPVSRTYNNVTSDKTAQNYVNPAPSASFDAWPLSLNVGASTEFHIVSTLNITSCSWDYGDGSGTGTFCSPYHTHTYSAPGFYTVSLTVTGPGGSSSITRTRYITVYPTLVVNKTGEGTGTVTSSPAGINCGSSCSGNFNYQAAVTLAAVPAPGSLFIGWSGGGCSGTSTCMVNLTTATTVTAHFEKIVASCPAITGWKGEYWVNASLSGTPALCRNDTNLDFDWGSGSPDPSIPADNFSAQWTRTVNLSGGIYRFYLDHDDGARLFIDDMVNPVLDKWGTCCTVDSSNPMTLSDGNHVIRMEYHEGGGDAYAHLWWVKFNPAVLSITHADLNPTGASSVHFNVSFSESVINVDVQDFSLHTSGIAGASITGVSGSETTRTVTVNTGSGNGTIRLDLVDDDSIRNTSSVPLGGVGVGNGNYSSGETYTVTQGVLVTIGAQAAFSSPVSPGSPIMIAPPNLVDGPVRVTSSRGGKLFTSERVISGTSFNEVMGYPANQMPTEYWFPWYDNVSMDTWILVGNASSTQAATVDIYIGGVKRYTNSIPAGGRITPRFNLQTGPVRVVSTNGVKIFSSERTLYKGAFNEVMGYPANRLTTEYWFPWYDNVGMDTWVLVGNPSSTQTANVSIYIGASKCNYTVPPNGRITPRYGGKLDGPVRVVSTNGVKIFSSERTLYGDSFNEVMGYPANQFTTEYWFPLYDNVDMSTWVLVGNPTASTAKVDIYVGAAKYSYTVPANGRIMPRLPGVNTGPVRVVSTNGVKIFTSERVLYGDSFNEAMGYPGNQLTTEYWFPWYDSTTMSTDIVVGRP